jgi:hypothetical protein
VYFVVASKRRVARQTVHMRQNSKKSLDFYDSESF